MKLLLDTHTFLWLASNPEHRSQPALASCEDPTNQLYLSVVSAWEIQIKRQINRLRLEVPFDQLIRGQQSANDLRGLPVHLHHVYVLAELPLYHNDPFDRLLVAQAKSEQAWLVSGDSRLRPYPVDIIW
jgi:PIN domain nuclease of toxin-antitoxin system